MQQQLGLNWSIEVNLEPNVHDSATSRQPTRPKPKRPKLSLVDDAEKHVRVRLRSCPQVPRRRVSEVYPSPPAETIKQGWCDAAALRVYGFIHEMNKYF